MAAQERRVAGGRPDLGTVYEPLGLGKKFRQPLCR